MAEFSRNKRNDTLWNNRRFDFAPHLSDRQMRQSVLDVRKVYPDLPDSEFAKWYASKYRVEAKFVRSVLEKYKKV